MSPDVAQFLLNILGAQHLSVGADDFAAVAELCARAKEELHAVLGYAEDD